MPELPEVETVRRGLEPLLQGRRIAASGSHPSSRFAQAGNAVGTTVTGVGRRGKYLMIPLDDGRQLVIHLGMTGRLSVGEPTEPGAYDRAWWDLDDGNRLTFRDVRRFGRVAVVSGVPSGLPTLDALGPEPFDPAFTAEVLWRSLRRSRSKVKTQLLNQRVVAGVGNIYADEALWRADIDPAARSVSRAAAGRLHEAVVDVLRAAIANGGTTLRDYRTVDGGEGANQHHLACYGRWGHPCPRCGTELRRKVVDGRTTTWCPACQRR